MVGEGAGCHPVTMEISTTLLLRLLLVNLGIESGHNRLLRHRNDLIMQTSLLP